MKNEDPGFTPSGKSTAGHSHDYSGGIHQKGKALRDSYAKANQKSANGTRIPDSVQPTPDPNRFQAYQDKAIPKEKESE